MQLWNGNWKAGNKKGDRKRDGWRTTGPTQIGIYTSIQYTNECNYKIKF